MRQIILDTETTGLSAEQGHRIIEIGCLEMVNRRLTGNHLHLYINPQRPVERAASEVHGISDDFLMDKPLFKDIKDQLLDYLKGAELVIHNAPFDVGFLNHEFKLVDEQFPQITKYCAVVDTLALARHKHPGQHNNLDALCRRYNVDNSNRDFHGALLDAELLAQVYLLMTGGQTQLFGGESAVEALQSTSIRRVVANRAPLPVIAANPEELQAHQEFLQLLRKQGNCVWHDKEGLHGQVD